LQMYPAYTVPTVLNEYAITFFALLNEGYRLRSENAMLLTQISAFPNMEKKDQDQFYKNLEWATLAPSDILNTGEGSSDADIKKLLG
jgi:hypothetical protein